MDLRRLDAEHQRVQARDLEPLDDGILQARDRGASGCADGSSSSISSCRAAGRAEPIPACAKTEGSRQFQVELRRANRDNAQVPVHRHQLPVAKPMPFSR
jgi:hypothetical protein